MIQQLCAHKSRNGERCALFEVAVEDRGICKTHLSCSPNTVNSTHFSQKTGWLHSTGFAHSTSHNGSVGVWGGEWSDPWKGCGLIQ